MFVRAYSVWRAGALAGGPKGTAKEAPKVASKVMLKMAPRVVPKVAPQVAPKAAASRVVPKTGLVATPATPATSASVEHSPVVEPPRSMLSPAPPVSPASLPPTFSSLDARFPQSLDDFSPGPDWTTLFHGLGAQPFPADVAKTLLEPIDSTDVEIKGDGMLYLPEIKYRRILNRAFGPGGWGLVARLPTLVTANSVTREYGLVCHGRLVAVARGEQTFARASMLVDATEGCKLNALMRCCKDLGVALELWDPKFLRSFKAKYVTKQGGAWTIKSR